MEQQRTTCAARVAESVQEQICVGHRFAVVGKGHDTGIGQCRLPASWRVLYQEDGVWKPVWTEQDYGVEKDAWNRVVFETVRTRAVRLEIRSQESPL